MNKVILMGRLTRDPDIRYTQPNSAQEQTWYCTLFTGSKQEI